MRLEDKVVVITGAASGIGKAIASTFAREGAKIVIADLNQKAADATASELDPAGRRALGVAMDVANEDQVNAGIDKAIATFGALDVLVSNAGIQIVEPLGAMAPTSGSAPRSAVASNTDLRRIGARKWNAAKPWLRRSKPRISTRC